MLSVSGNRGSTSLYGTDPDTHQTTYASPFRRHIISKVGLFHSAFDELDQPTLGDYFKPLSAVSRRGGCLVSILQGGDFPLVFSEVHPDQHLYLLEPPTGCQKLSPLLAWIGLYSALIGPNLPFLPSVRPHLLAQHS